MLTKRMEKKLDGNYTRMLQAILNKSRRQRPTTHQLYGHLQPITKKVRRTRHVGHGWRSLDEIISEIPQWTSSQGRAKVGRLVRTYIRQLSADTVYSLEDPRVAMDDSDGWRESVRYICTGSAT